MTASMTMEVESNNNYDNGKKDGAADNDAIATDISQSYSLTDLNQSNPNGGAGLDLQQQQQKIKEQKDQKGDEEKPKRLVDKYGFIIDLDGGDGEDGNASANAVESKQSTEKSAFEIRQEVKKGERRDKKWKAQIKNWDRRKNQNTLKRRLRKGVPDWCRGDVWVLLGGAIKKPGVYDDLVKKTNNNSSSFQQSDGTYYDNVQLQIENGTNTGNNQAERLETSPSVPAGPAPDTEYSITFRTVRETIERDIHRTYPRHSMFYEEERSAIMDIPSTISATDTDQHAATLEQACGAGFAQLNDIITGGNDDGDLSAKDGGNGAGIESNGGSTQPRTLHNQQSIMKTPSMQLSVPEPPKGQASLRRVLRAYSYYDQEVGYCQGMNFIAGMFLTVMPEEDAFWLLVGVMSHKPCEMRGLFGEGMRETHKVLHVADRLIHHFLPRLAKHFDKENVHVTMYATQWLLTQYTSSFKFDLVLRVWDSFLGEGWKIIYRVMLALLSIWQQHLLKKSFEEILAFFRELPNMVEGQQVMEAALKIPLRAKHISNYEAEWAKSVTGNNSNGSR